MTSEERRQGRYLRRKARRSAGKQLHFDQGFTYEHLYTSYRKCCRNVTWKASVQRYVAQAPLNIEKTRQRLLSGRYRSPDFFEFDIHERGKKRHIRSTVIGERVVQRCLCDYALVPAVTSGYIYDNGACIKNKGYDFAANRMRCHLEKYIRKNGPEGYVLVGDLKSFFDSIPHREVERVLRKHFTDEWIVGLTMNMVHQFTPGVPRGTGIGLGLGSQVSQVLAPSVPGVMDHFVKEVLQEPYYGRYMDDFYLFHRDKRHLQKCLDLIRAELKKVGLTLSEKKTQIVKLSRGFTFLKVRTTVTKTGKIVRRIHPASVTRERRRLKKLKAMLDAGTVNRQDVYNSFQSWYSHAARFDSWNTRQTMKALYRRLFDQGGVDNGLHQNSR